MPESISRGCANRKRLSLATLESRFLQQNTYSLMPRLGPSTTPHVIDVGSGPGFPGLPIKMWAPHVHLTLIESNSKKATFLREVVRNLRLTGVDVFASRANLFTGSRGDVVTLRAVERFGSILRWLLSWGFRVAVSQYWLGKLKCEG